MQVNVVLKRFLACSALAALLAPAGAYPEFYSYEDKNGTVHFVDEQGKIPREYRKKSAVRKDKYDDLSESDRRHMLKMDQEALEKARLREDVQREKARQARDEDEKKEARKRLAEALTTRVVISGRQVFVPVTMGNGSIETEALLLLDTGATSSVITPEVAARLNIEQSDNVRVGVVGGRVLKARKAILSHMKVGPVRRTEQEVIIIRQRGNEMGDGLLGMSFLAGLKYTIDFKKQTIDWIP